MVCGVLVHDAVGKLTEWSQAKDSVVAVGEAEVARRSPSRQEILVQAIAQLKGESVAVNDSPCAFILSS